MGKQFAKLFGPEGDQILVLRTQTDEGAPCVQLIFDPEAEGPALLTIGWNFEDDDAADEAFVTEFGESVVKLVVETTRKRLREVVEAQKEVPNGPVDKG